MQMAFCNGNNKEYERMLNGLLKEVFFDFQFWYDLGLWDENYRGRGLSRQLMEHIMATYEDIPMYLSANESVLDFYPRFGFERVYKKQPVSTGLDCDLGDFKFPELSLT